jgi:hypothetical protein
MEWAYIPDIGVSPACFFRESQVVILQERKTHETTVDPLGRLANNLQ